MTNWENEIIDVIVGETPLQKFNYIKSLMWENPPEKEAELLNIVHSLKIKGQELYKTMGSSSYSLRCAIYDASEDIYKLTNKCKIEHKTMNQWLNEIERLKQK